MANTYLSLATKEYPENASGGLMICGINWAGEEDSTPPTRDEYGPSFFSDARYVAGPSPYRARIIRWFELLGHPLAGTEELAGPFERSIVQTNWMNNQSPNVRGGVRAKLVASWENFEFHVTRLSPRLIMFMGVTLLEVLNSRKCAGLAERIFGRGSSVRWEVPDVVSDGVRQRELSFGIQEFERASVLAFPHPSGTIGLTDAHIVACAWWMPPVISRFKAGLTAQLSLRQADRAT